MAKSLYLAGALFDEVYGGSDYTPAATIYVALFVDGVEVSALGYARVAVTNNATEWPAASGDPVVKTNGNAITFPTALASWGTPNIVATMDDSSGGNVLDIGPIASPVAVGIGDTYEFGAGELQFTETDSAMGATDLLVNPPPGVLTYARGAYVFPAGGATTTLVDFTSAGSGGYISLIHLMNQSSHYNSYGASVVKVYRDGSGTPDFEIPWEMLGCMKYADVSGATRPITKYFSHNAGSGGFCFELAIPIPFTTGIKITVTNGDVSNAMSLWWDIEIHDEVPNTWTYTKRLLAVSDSTDGNVQDSTVTMLDISDIGGQLFGIYMGWDAFPGSADPKPAIMEGQVKYYFDGSGTPDYWSSGLEDYFGFNGYGVEFTPPSVTDYHGMTDRSADGNWWNFYKWHTNGPVVFNTGLKVTVGIGDSTRGPAASGGPLDPPYTATGSWRVWYTLFYYVDE